jgi:hypothetical protein
MVAPYLAGRSRHEVGASRWCALPRRQLARYPVPALWLRVVPAASVGVGDVPRTVIVSPVAIRQGEASPSPVYGARLLSGLRS